MYEESHILGLVIFHHPLFASFSFISSLSHLASHLFFKILNMSSLCPSIWSISSHWEAAIHFFISYFSLLITNCLMLTSLILGHVLGLNIMFYAYMGPYVYVVDSIWKFPLAILSYDLDIWSSRQRLYPLILDA